MYNIILFKGKNTKEKQYITNADLSSSMLLPYPEATDMEKEGARKQKKTHRTKQIEGSRNQL